MACTLTIWNTQTKQKNVVVCDEDSVLKIVQDDHAARGAGDYVDTKGAKFSVDWTKCRLVRFARQRA